MKTNMFQVALILLISLIIVIGITLMLQYRIIKKLESIESQLIHYHRDEELESYKVVIDEIRDDIYENRRLSLKQIGEIRTLLFKFQTSFMGVLSDSDQKHIASMLELLANPAAVDFQIYDEAIHAEDSNNENFKNFRARLCEEMDYFSAKFDSKNSFHSSDIPRSSRATVSVG